MFRSRSATISEFVWRLTSKGPGVVRGTLFDLTCPRGWEMRQSKKTYDPDMHSDCTRCLLSDWIQFEIIPVHHGRSR